MSWQRRGWALFAAILIVGYTALSLSLPAGPRLTWIGNFVPLGLMLLATAVMALNAWRAPRNVRAFWILWAAGCFFWTINQSLWTYYEAIRQTNLPEPFFGDIILFLHVVPFMAAVALRPHRSREGQNLFFSTVNFFMLLIWWVFLYAFLVFPEEFILLQVNTYSRNYDLLYLFENLLLVLALGALAATTRGPWRKLYWNLCVANALYAFNSLLMNLAIGKGVYYTGSFYDVAFLASICWLIWSGLVALEQHPVPEPAPPVKAGWITVTPRLAMLAILSLPLMGFWVIFRDPAPAPLRQFRLLVLLLAMLVLGSFAFLRQYQLDQSLARLLRTSQEGLDNLRRLQQELIQQEKLASLGQLVAGAAHEINHPLSAILGYSDLLRQDTGLRPEQSSMVNKISDQARRTRDLVLGLLSFAQQAPGEKSLLDMGEIVRRAVKMEMLRLESKKIQVSTNIPNDLPQIYGNTSQLLQCCLQIINNAMQAMEESGGGTLSVQARQENLGGRQTLLVEFLDSGPGIKDPGRVFDPFYTTKPIGKGTGLGLSVSYGLVHDHHGQITCQNRPEGGAAFYLRFPAATPA